METYEYTTFSYEPKGFFGGIVEEQAFRDRLNALGAQGWEMVSCVSVQQGYGSTRNLVAIFKRKVNLSEK